MRTLHVPLSFALLGAVAAVGLADSPRRETSFNDGWLFSRGDVPEASRVMFDDSAWEHVNLPHTWNAKDDLPGNKLYQGPGWYRKEFIGLREWQGRRLFLRFGAASLVSQVYLNGVLLGEHVGGFGAFCYELTPLLQLDVTNQLAVRVDNRRGSVSPLGGDFTIYGGLYRSVTLVETGPIAITPLDYASPGVYLKQTHVTDDRADVDVTTKISNASAIGSDIVTVVSIFDAKHRLIVSDRTRQLARPRDITDVRQRITIEQPHLWNGVSGPYLYTARIELFDAGRRIDSVEQPLGLRYFGQDAKRGFLLNGKPMQIHGVCRHQDWAGTGWAINEKQQEIDIAIMREMGVNGVRLAHYQHNPYFYSLCDKNGVIAWAELALVNNVRNTPEFRQNVRQQLTELIRQNYNHPSILMWSMYNEVGSGGRDKPGAIIENLGELAHMEDPTRPTTGAASGDTMANLPDVMLALDLVSLNLYSGWYGGKPSDIGPAIDHYNARYGSKGVSVSEYGAGASIQQHQQGMTKGPNPNSHFHPEEWQAILHEITYPAIKARPFVWGSFLWVMFDFTSAGRHEGDADGINDKGLVTRDRKTRKDAFYFYKANWTTAPMVYITSRRDNARTEATTVVKVYSNCEVVRLKVNGQSYGEMSMPAGQVFVQENVTLRPGSNVIEVQGTAHGKTVKDSCKWTYHAK
jgi:beta-galactosidase